MNTLDSVLNLSKLEGGRRVLTTELVDLSAEAESTVEELRADANEKEIALSVEVGDESVWAQADGGALQLAARNLVKNVIKYTESGGTVEVRTWADGDAATLAVEDTGIGISEEALPHVFDPFRQESEGLGREYEGVGLGLAIVKQAAQQMKGRVEVDTEKGEGTTFLLRLRRAEKTESEE